MPVKVRVANSTLQKRQVKNTAINASINCNVRFCVFFATIATPAFTTVFDDVIVFVKPAHTFPSSYGTRKMQAKVIMTKNK